jgi:DNA-binding transcriptional regulator LsrR (DeoR family)
MAPVEELRLMAKVARMYYEMGLTQPEIAERLDLSQATISRLLKRAEKEKIVRITVSQPLGVYGHLEEELKAIYGLKEAIVADAESDQNEDILHAIGAAAAYYLETTLKQNEIIGISSWSTTLLAVVKAMHSCPRASNARVVQAQGGIGNPTAEIHAANLTRRLAELVQGKAVFLPAPGVVDSTALREMFLRDPYVSEAIQLLDQVTLALVGIGTIEPSPLLASSGNVFSAQERADLNGLGAVGDVCLRFFNQNGEPLTTPLDDRVIGINFEQLRRVKRVVGVAGGERKVRPIHAALLGKWVNVLVIDHYTAEKLLKRMLGRMKDEG